MVFGRGQKYGPGIDHARREIEVLREEGNSDDEIDLTLGNVEWLVAPPLEPALIKKIHTL